MSERMRKGQMQSMETIAVVIVLVILVLIGLVFYANTSKSSIDQEGLARKLVKADTLAKKLHSMQELSCPNYGSERTPCIDLVKADVFSYYLTDPAAPGYFENKKRYFSLFGNTDVNLTIIYPPSLAGGPPITLYGGIETGPENKRNVFAKSVPVAVLNPADGAIGMGLLTAEVSQ